jgi:alkanesulfonate monooxygenase SsuD/methylene tetrahydromethanopterin reductase-like flavin-dependent oxidoreductase (luciferase family)
LRFGVGLPLDGTRLDGVIEYACTAEVLGFDAVMTADHASIGYEALMTLTAIAMRTQRIKLGTLVLDGNRRDPAMLAHTTATLDRISGGRLIVGIGKGVFNEASYGFPLKKPVSRMREVITVLKKLWTEDEVNHAGEFFTYAGFRLASQPLQTPSPPLWVAAFGRRMLRIAAAIGDGFVTQNMPPRLFEKCVQRARAAASQAGRDPEQVEAVYGMMPLAVAGDRWTARKMIEAAATSFLLRHARRLSKALGYATPWTMRGTVPAAAVDECFVFGTPEECAERVNAYRRAGATYIVFQSVLPPGLASLKSLARAVFQK